MAGNEAAGGLAKQAAEGPFQDFSEVPDRARRQAGTFYLHRRATEQRSRGTAQWVASPRATRAKAPSPGRFRFTPQGPTQGPKVPGWALLPADFRPYHNWIFLAREDDRPHRSESSECRWCGSGKRESRHHLFTECQAWSPQVRRLWKRVERTASEAPAVRSCGEREPLRLFWSF